MNYVRLYLAYICWVLIENVKNMHFVNLFYIIYLGQVKLTTWKPRALVVYTIYSEKWQINVETLFNFWQSMKYKIISKCMHLWDPDINFQYACLI